MTCSTCGAPADPGQKFCGSCGTSLARACPNCGATATATQRFCSECGTGLAAGDGSPTGAIAPARGTSAAMPVGDADHVAERRLVTVVFVDLVGSTSIAEGQDAEDVRETLSRYFDLATEVLGRYGGTIEKFIGDAVMAVWGTPTAREDDAERAVRAAIDLVDSVRTLGPGIQARGGVLTGEAAVTLGATNQGMVAGDLVNTASRLQSAAPPGGVLVGEATYRAAMDAIAFEAVDALQLKGKAEPIPAWRAVRVVAERGGRGRREAVEGPMVGRDDELRLLKDLLQATVRERRARIVSVQGIGGIGKSRLAWEFEKYLDGIVDSVWWHHGRSPAYGEGVTFWALGEMVRTRAGLAETDDEATTRAAITTLMNEHLADDPDRRWVEQALLELLGVRTGIPSDELFGAWRTFFERLAATAPVVLVFSDLHWADGGTLDFIDHVLEWSRGHAIYIVTMSRPELLDRRPDWGAAQRNFARVHLDPLSEDDMGRLLDALVPGLPATTRAAVVARAEGVPLYAVETVRMLQAMGRLAPDGAGVLRPVAGSDGAAIDLADVAIPETLTALIAARLDALDPSDRAILLDAAVLGQSFTPAGVAAVAGADASEVEPRLRSLVRREVLTHVADPRSPERGQFAFVQALIREVAYNRLARRDRKVRHLAAARWFESLGEDELAAALAGHYLAARSLATDAAEADALAAQARIALRSAADRAASLGSHRQALALYDQALEVTSDPLAVAELSERAGDSAVADSNADAATAHFSRAADSYRSLGDRSAAASAISRLADYLSSIRLIDRVVPLVDAAVIEFADLGDDPGRIRILARRARLASMTSDFPTAIATADEVLTAAEAGDLLDVLTDALATKSGALAGMGRFREANALIEASATLAEEQGLTTTMLRARMMQLSRTIDTDPVGAFAGSMEATATARRLGRRDMVQALVGNAAYGALRAGTWEIAKQELLATMSDEAVDFDRTLGVNNLVNILAFQGEPFDIWLSELTALVEASADPNARTYLLESQAWIATLDLRLDDARRDWAEMVQLDPSNPGIGDANVARLDLWTGDADLAEPRIVAFLAGNPRAGAVLAIRDGLTAGIHAVRGELHAARAGYRDALEAMEALHLPVDPVFVAMDMARLLGPDDPAASAAVERARELAAGLGSAPLKRMLDAAVEAGSRAQLTTTSPTPGASTHVGVQ